MGLGNRTQTMGREILDSISYNKYQSYGTTAEVANLEPLEKKWEAFGFAVEEVDGHDIAALSKVFERVPHSAGRPLAVICHTIKGRGIHYAENNPAWHHQSRIGSEGFQKLSQALDSD